LHVPRKQFIVISFFAGDVSVICGSMVSHACNLA
jgi:hypothetical protein